MKMAGQMGLLFTTLIMVSLLKSTNAERYMVGDDFGWNIPPNISFYSEWASSKNFQIRDEVSFTWTGNNHNVAEVSTLDEYQNCTKPGLVITSNVTANLLSNGSRFFLSTVDDQCERGMKVILTVGSPTNTSALTPNRACSLPSLSFGVAVAFLVVFFNYV